MSQSLAQVLLHITFSTKYQQATIYPDIEKELFAYIVSICADCGCYVHQINAAKDHVHIACNLSRTITIAKLIEEVKKNSSKWIKTKDPKYNKFYWQQGYGVFSLGMSSLDVVKKYIANQKEHHRHKTFKEEFLEFLHKYEIDYDDKYLWD